MQYTNNSLMCGIIPWISGILMFFELERNIIGQICHNCNTPHTCLVIVGIGRNAPVLQVPSDVRMRACDTVVKHPVPCMLRKL